LLDIMDSRRWSFPIILKPDVGQRGAGVRLIHDLYEAAHYFREIHGTVIAQVFHSGAFEAGVFYYRIPGHRTGRLFSITDKGFPELIGDGRSTIRELIWRDRRFRMQAEVFLMRHRRHLRRVLAAGERFPLVVAGNHCQGSIFRDGSHLLTPHLEDAIDRIARSFKCTDGTDGFFFGRFDIRYSEVEQFKTGQDLAIVELNGVTSESTNIYDPRHSLFAAWGTVFRQWRILFRIGAENRRRGARESTTRELLGAIIRHFRARRAPTLAD
jgi:hypothetical protein